jgi:CRISPR-associated protein Cmr2
MSPEHLLVFSIGPVQAFISAARRGRDLWFSSWLLSEIARAAGQAVRDHLVMPTALMVNDPNSAVSNKLLVHIQAGEPATIAQGMERAARDRLREIRETAFSDLSSDLIDKERADAQVDDLLEFAWASADLRPGRDYGQARQLAEALLAARKTCRPFAAPSWARAVPKSSLDGERETVLKPSAKERERDDIRQRLHKLGIGPSEHLCGVGLLKRRGYRAAPAGSGGRVQSTSHVASWSLRQRFAVEGDIQRRCREAFEIYERTLERLGADLSSTPERVPVLGWRDGHILYESRLHDLFPKGSQEEVRQARVALGHLFMAWKKADEELPTLTPYYAVLLADGDHMGKAIDAIRTVADHRRVTETLERFAADAPALVGEHHGHCIYAGGDDVLALLPVTEALSCAEALRKEFGAVSQDFEELGASTIPTLSVGINVAHHVDPLQDALQGARAAERHAKQVIERDGWAVRVDKRSGAPTLTGGKWAVLPWLTESIEAMTQVGLSRGLPHEILELARQIPGEKLASVRRAELRRVLAQKDLDPEMFAEQLGPEGDLKALAQRLVIARTLSGMEGDHD